MMPEKKQPKYVCWHNITRAVRNSHKIGHSLTWPKDLPVLEVGPSRQSNLWRANVTFAENQKWKLSLFCWKLPVVSLFGQGRDSLKATFLAKFFYTAHLFTIFFFFFRIPAYKVTFAPSKSRQRPCCQFPELCSAWSDLEIYTFGLPCFGCGNFPKASISAGKSAKWNTTAWNSQSSMHIYMYVGMYGPHDLLGSHIRDSHSKPPTALPIYVPTWADSASQPSRWQSVLVEKSRLSTAKNGLPHSAALSVCPVWRNPPPPNDQSSSFKGTFDSAKMLTTQRSKEVLVHTNLQVCEDWS